MVVPGSVLDGSPGYGSVLVTFSSSGNFIAESITPSRPVQIARDRKLTGEPGRSRYTRDFDSFTCVLQAPQTFTGWPTFGEICTLTLDDNYGVEKWICMPPEATITNDAASLRKLNVTMYKQNCTTVTTVAASAVTN